MSWPRRFRTYWVVCNSQGTAYLSTARTRRSASIAAWTFEESTLRKKCGLKGPDRDWAYWRRYGYRCQRVDVKVRNTP